MGLTTRAQLLLDRLREASSSSRQLALLRIESWGKNKDDNDDVDHAGGGAASHHSTGLAHEVVCLFREAIDDDDAAAAHHHHHHHNEAASILLEILCLLQHLAVADTTLFEEVAATAGFRTCLDAVALSTTTTTTATTTVVDAALRTTRAKAVQEIRATMSALTTAHRDVPFTRPEVHRRLPLVFGMPQPQNGGEGEEEQQQQQQEVLQVMVHQVTSEEETDSHDTGFVMWPSSVLLARHLALHPAIVTNIVASGHEDTETSHRPRCILELGAGCGLVGLTAATLLQRHQAQEEQEPDSEEATTTRVIFTDYCPTVLENIQRNLDLNELASSGRVAGLDFFDQPGNEDSQYDRAAPHWIDTHGAPRPQVGLVLAADVIFHTNDAENVARTIYASLVDGGRALVVNGAANRRFGVEEFPHACEEAGLEVVRTEINALRYHAQHDDDQELLIHDMDQTSMQNWSVQDLSLVMFTITKPVSRRH